MIHTWTQCSTLACPRSGSSQVVIWASNSYLCHQGLLSTTRLFCPERAGKLTSKVRKSRTFPYARGKQFPGLWSAVSYKELFLTRRGSSPQREIIRAGPGVCRASGPGQASADQPRGRECRGRPPAPRAALARPSSLRPVPPHLPSPEECRNTASSGCSRPVPGMKVCQVPSPHFRCPLNTPSRTCQSPSRWAVKAV